MFIKSDLVFLLLPVLPFLIAWHIIAGLAIAPINPLMRTVMQERLPAEMRARVFGTMIAGIPLSTLLSGYSVGWIGLQVRSKKA